MKTDSLTPQVSYFGSKRTIIGIAFVFMSEVTITPSDIPSCCDDFPCPYVAMPLKYRTTDVHYSALTLSPS